MDLLGGAIELIAWIAVGVIGVVMLSQAIGWSGTRVVATLQALTPQLALILAPIAGTALWQNSWALAVIAGIIGLGALALIAPLVSRPTQAQPPDDSLELRVAMANLLYGNEETHAIADDLATRNPDVIVFNEYTPEHQAVLRASALADEYPFKIDQSGPLAGGIAVWSRHELTVGEPPKTFDPSLDVVAQTTAGPVRIVAVHPRTPVYDFSDWRDDLRALGKIDRSPDEAILLIGDFNATFWHPRFRDLMKTGYVDAHVAAGRLFSTSWPNGGLIPRFVRLDHALAAGQLLPTAVDDFDIPGSDHRGFMVTVAATR